MNRVPLGFVAVVVLGIGSLCYWLIFWSWMFEASFK